VAHGSEPRDYSQRTPKKMKRLAVRSALSARAAEGNVRVIESFTWSEPKTKSAVRLLEAIGASGKTLVVLSAADSAAYLAFRNLPQVAVTEPDQLTAYHVLWAQHLIFTSQTVQAVGGQSGYQVSKSDFVREEA
jgi:large subunit ribosomal protein L4